MENKYLEEKADEYLGLVRQAREGLEKSRTLLTSTPDLERYLVNKLKNETEIFLGKGFVAEMAFQVHKKVFYQWAGKNEE